MCRQFEGTPFASGFSGAAGWTARVVVLKGAIQAEAGAEDDVFKLEAEHGRQPIADQ